MLINKNTAKMDKIPLNYEASEGDTHKQVTASLPSEVVQCLENARFVSDHKPSVLVYSIMSSSQNVASSRNEQR